MEVRNLLSVQAFSSEKMKKINLFETERVLCDVYCLEPGQAQKVHTHEDADKIYVVLSGQARVRLSLLVFMAPVHIHRHHAH